MRLGSFACKLGGLDCDGMGMDMSSNRFELFSMMGSDDTQRDPETIRHRWERKGWKKILGVLKGKTTMIK